jgi:hypothetical protein
LVVTGIGREDEIPSAWRQLADRGERLALGKADARAAVFT